MSNPADSPLTAASPSSSPGPAEPAASPNQASQNWILFSVVAIGIVAGVSIFMLLNASGADVSTAARAAAPTPGTGTAPVSTAVRASARPKWTGGVRRSNGRNVAVYQLEAENDVALWGKVVRPVLTVRCIAGTTEVFVLTQSAAAIDGDDGKHTVQVGYDRDPDAAERWLASDDYDALFAENGVGSARRIAAAQTMRFGFTPYNAAPVVARFEVTGFDAIAGKLAQPCRW
jgi:hypothetical protein